MGCEGEEVTEENTKALKNLEDDLSYPPRFQIKFECDNDNVEKTRTEVTVTFDGLLYHGNPPTFMITLKKPGQYNCNSHVYSLYLINIL